LTILEHQETRLKLLTEILPKFEQTMADQGKNIKVKLQEGPAPNSEFITKLTLDFNSGNVPDVVSYGGTSTPDFAAAAYLLDLTPLLMVWPD